MTRIEVWSSRGLTVPTVGAAQADGIVATPSST